MKQQTRWWLTAVSLKLALIGLFWALPLMPPQSTGLALNGQAFAEEKKSAKPKKRRRTKTRRVPAMREAVYKELAKAQVMIDPESVPREEGEPPPVPDGTPQDAVELLLKLQHRKGMNGYELAQVWNTLAFAYYTLDDIPKTIAAYEKILSEGTISIALELSTLRALFQLYYSQERYDKSLSYIDRWLELNGSPDASVTFIKATIYYQLKDIQKSLKYALEVQAITEAQGNTMRENWWYLQVVLFSELERSDDVIRVLEILVAQYPKKQYWMHLAGMYSEKAWDDKALSAYHAAYTQGFLTKESEVVMLAQRLLSLDEAPNPYEASQVLEKGFEEELIEENEKHLRLLATAYTLSQEATAAIDTWRKATKYADDGELHYRLAQALANEDRHVEAIESYEAALEKGELKKPADVNFWLAVSQMQLERWEAAIDSFTEAGELDEDKEEQTSNYITYIKGERARLEALDRALAQALEDDTEG